MRTGDTVHVDTSKFNRMIERLSDVSDKDAKTVLQDQGRLLVKQLIRLTPPKTQAQGRRAIMRDLFSGAFFVMEDYMVKNAEESKGEVRKLWGSEDGPVGVDRHNYNPDASIQDMEARHRFLQNKRGRVRGGKARVKKGGWTIIQRMAVKERSAKRYFRKVAAAVGRQKAGWAPAYKALGGSVPGWVSRHLSGARGVYYGLTNSGGNWGLAFANSATGVTNYENVRRFESAIRIRTQALARQIRLILSGYSKDVKRGIIRERGGR